MGSFYGEVRTELRRCGLECPQVMRAPQSAGGRWEEKAPEPVAISLHAPSKFPDKTREVQIS